MILEAKNVSFAYRRRGKSVLQNVSLTVESGEITGLFTPSGYGKTTLCRLLAGYEKPDSGQILLDGKPLSSYRGFCPVQMIWQNPETAVDPLIRLGETLREAGGVEDRILDALHIAPAWLSRYPTELSGGELQRFCIARALRPELKFLLCDETTAMLDLITQAQIWDFLITEARERGLGMLIVSHSAALLERLCAKVKHLPMASKT